MINNFYFIDKPINYTSFDVIRILRKRLNIKKIGHTGTLDPLATGGLLIATGHYTKLISYLEKQPKEYIFDITLDGVSESFDLGTKITYINNKKQEYFKNNLKKSQIEILLKKNFFGKIQQIPPKYSALKINGERAYNLVRKGKKINMKSREVEIFNIKVLNFNYPILTLKSKVSAGTYIRSIAYDLGKILGTGGYISKLRRTKIGKFDVKNALDLNNFKKEKYLKIKDIFDKNRFINLDKNILNKINNGLKVRGNFNLEKNIDFFICDDDNKISNIVKYDGDFIIPKRKI